MITSLKPFNLTIVVFDAAQGPDGGTRYVLPVDSPDAEHSCASTLADAASLHREDKGRQGTFRRLHGHRRARAAIAQRRGARGAPPPRRQ